eukprot:TRINITY_DN3599_c2_g2_i1.p1 TRINITY_DN3599_c2_g2~~TRINITY_DN3599_c2_g2_i1.p1  ORF type:complete len:374 (+),score=195.69 TRINITY_DN3599_c2_g2_i1:81-1124(+)
MAMAAVGLGSALDAKERQSEGVEALLGESSSDGNSDSPRHTPELRPQRPPDDGSFESPKSDDDDEQHPDWDEGKGFEEAEEAEEEADGADRAPAILLSSSSGSLLSSGSSTDDYLAACEESERSTLRSDPPSPRGRFDGHPLGRQALEVQQQEVQQYHNSLWEEKVSPLRNVRWTVETSAARAKVLVSEAYFLEKRHLTEQLEWLETHPQQRGVTRRFRSEYQYPNSSFVGLPADLLDDPAMHKAVVKQKLAGLRHRWGTILKQVSQQMESADEFPDVIRNLSTMRIFLEGQQAQQYGIDVQQQQRRMMRYQQILDLVEERQDGYFLRDALPRRGEQPAGRAEEMTC